MLCPTQRRGWIVLTVEKASGERVERQDRGTPQGGVLSPLLANLFLHSVLDKWLSKHYPEIKFVRYADDMIIHCGSQEQAQRLLEEVTKRLEACKLSLNEEKTQIVYCKDYRRTGKPAKVKFDFLGYRFQPRSFRSPSDGSIKLGFGPAISTTSSRRIIEEVRTMKEFSSTQVTLEKQAQELNPKIRGWLNYYGKFRRSEMQWILYHLSSRIVRWLRKKYKRLKASLKKAKALLERIRRETPDLFYPWRLGL